MARQVAVSADRSDAYLQPVSSSSSLDYRRIYREMRSQSSVPDLRRLAESMRGTAKRLAETADRPQKR